MKHIKTYEDSIYGTPVEGDYIIVDTERDLAKYTYLKPEYRSNQVAQIIRILNNKMLANKYEIRFDDGFETFIGGDDFIIFSDDKDELEREIQLKKYNL